MSDATVTPSYYADFEGLNALKKDVKGNDPQAIREAARQFESLFTDMMLKSMRAAKLGEGLGDSDQTDFYQDMYDQQLAVKMSEGKGLGLADMLVQQLTRSGAIKGTAAASGTTGTAGTPSTAATPSTPGSAAQRTQPSAATSTNAQPSGSASASKTSGTISHRERIGFIQRLEPYAQRAASALGVSADSLIAQAALETGWGRHLPASGSASSNNLFGIKATNWQGAVASAQTTEYNQGTPARLTQAFRSYGSVQQGIGDYVHLLRAQPGYQGALGTGDNVNAFAAALQRGGYATDPNYAEKLVDTAATVRALRGGTSSDALVAQSTTPTALKLADPAPITRDGEPT